MGLTGIIEFIIQFIAIEYVNFDTTINRNEDLVGYVVGYVAAVFAIMVLFHGIYGKRGRSCLIFLYSHQICRMPWLANSFRTRIFLLLWVTYACEVFGIAFYSLTAPTEHAKHPKVVKSAAAILGLRNLHPEQQNMVAIAERVFCWFGTIDLLLHWISWDNIMNQRFYTPRLLIR